MAEKNAADAVKSAPDQAGGINISVSYGQSKSESTTISDSERHQGSSISAGGNLTLTARGSGKDSE